MARRIRIHGIRREEIDSDLLAYCYFLEGKRRRLQRRQYAEEAKAKRQGQLAHTRGPRRRGARP